MKNVRRLDGLWAPRVHGKVVTKDDHRVWRLRPRERYEVTGDYDCSSEIFEFVVPSGSRPNRFYLVRLDAKTCELACPCEALSCFRNAPLMPYRDAASSTMLEFECRQAGMWWLPIITRPPRSLCPHGRAIRLWLKRHGIFPVLETIEGLLSDHFDPKKTIDLKLVFKDLDDR